ncbi:MAG: 2-hydroxymuconate tautomerase family protein [Oceanospirillaceae bacterium]
MIIPYVNIKIFDEQVKGAQKAQLVNGVTQLLVDVLNNNPATTVTIIDEINTDNWVIGGEVITDLRKKTTS